MTEYDNEPIPGLPGILPAGERILWQGSPDPRVLARTAFHTRLVAGYFAVLVAVALTSALAAGIRSLADLTGTALTIAGGIAGVGLLHLLAWGTARTTVYTLTDKRIVLRIGITLPKCINLPLRLVAAADLDRHADGTGDIALTVTGEQKLGYAGLWPHARPWRLAVPQPMLRGIADADAVAALVAGTCLAAHPDGRIPPIALPEAGPFGTAVAA